MQRSHGCFRHGDAIWFDNQINKRWKHAEELCVPMSTITILEDYACRKSKLVHFFFNCHCCSPLLRLFVVPANSMMLNKENYSCLC